MPSKPFATSITTPITTPDPDTAPVLRADGLGMWRGAHCLFEGLEFEAGPGQIVLVVGANGAGKTTLLRSLAGLTLPSAGRATWGGFDVRALPDGLRASIAYRGHADGLKRELSVIESLDFVNRLFGADQNTRSLADDLGLGARTAVPVRQLSAGQRRRVGFGALQLAGARLWVLDEPMTHLDSAGRRLVIDWIGGHTEQGGTAVVATHRPDELARSGALIVEL